jgi:hypothetical protein
MFIQTGWLWATAIACLLALAAPLHLSYEWRSALATVVVLESGGAVLILYAVLRAGGLRTPFSRAVATSQFALIVIGSALALGRNLESLLGLGVLVRIGWDVLRYQRHPPMPDGARARSYFLILCQSALALVLVVPVLIFVRVPVFDQSPLLCDSHLCRLASPPDRILVIGAFLYPALALLATCWKPAWNYWLPKPR